MHMYIRDGDVSREGMKPGRGGGRAAHAAWCAGARAVRWLSRVRTDSPSISGVDVPGVRDPSGGRHRASAAGRCAGFRAAACQAVTGATSGRSRAHGVGGAEFDGVAREASRPATRPVGGGDGWIAAARVEASVRWCTSTASSRLSAEQAPRSHSHRLRRRWRCTVGCVRTRT